MIVTVSVGAGTVSDCWEITERGAAFSILFIGQFFGPLVGKLKGTCCILDLVLNDI